MGFARDSNGQAGCIIWNSRFFMKKKHIKPKSEEVEKENPRESEDLEEIPQDEWDKFDDAMDKILKVPKRPPNQQAG